jgi:hypothetical protein
MLQEDDSLDDSSWCSDTADAQISKLPMRLDIYIEKRVKHQFSALNIQKIVRGWLVRKRSYVSNDVVNSVRDFNLLKFRGNLVHEHAAAVAVEDMTLEDSFTSDNESINYEKQFSNEQLHLQKQMAKVEELSNVLERRAKIDIQINEAQLSTSQEIKKSPKNSPALILSSHNEKESELEFNQVNLKSSKVIKPLSPTKEVKSTGNSKDITSPVKSPTSSASSPKGDLKIKSNEKMSDEINSPVSINLSPTREEHPMHEVQNKEKTSNDIKSPLITSPLQNDDSYGDPEDFSFERSSEIQDSQSHDANAFSVGNNDKVLAIDIKNLESPIQIKADSAKFLKDTNKVDVVEQTETSEVIEDDFEIEEDEDHEVGINHIDNNKFNNTTKDKIYNDDSDDEIEEEDIINDLSSPGKATILEDDDDEEEVQFETYSNDSSTISEFHGESTSKSDENKKTSLTSLSDMPPLKPITTSIKADINNTDFDELYDFDEKVSNDAIEMNKVKSGTVDIPVIDWVENVESFISHLLVKFDMKNVIRKLDDETFHDKFIPVELFDSIYANFQNEHNFIDHCRAVYDRVNELLTELHTLRHASSIINESYTSILLAKNMIINENNIKNYIKEKLLIEQKKVYGILPEIKVDVLSEIESTLQSNLNKAADELTDIILARMLNDISQQLH